MLILVTICLQKIKSVVRRLKRYINSDYLVRSLSLTLPLYLAAHLESQQSTRGLKDYASTSGLQSNSQRQERCPIY